MANFQKDKGAYLNKREELDINIGEYLLKLKRRWVPALAVFVFTVGTTAFLSSFLEKTYKSEGKILFKKNPVGSLVDIGEDTNQFSSLLNDQTPLSTEELRITSQPVLQQTIDQLKLEDEEGNPLNTKELEKRLNVEILGGTDVISLSYRDQDPVTASKVVNALMDIYIKEQAISNQSATVNADSFITNTIPKIEGKLQSLESRLQDFYEKNQVVDLKEEKEF